MQRIAFEAADGQLGIGSEDEYLARTLQLPYLSKALVVVGAAHFERRLQVLVLGIEDAAKPVHRFVHPEIHRSGEHDDDLVAALFKRFVQRDIVHQTAVQILLPVRHRDAMGYERQRPRCAQPLYLLVAVRDMLVLRLARAHVGDGGKDPGLGLLVGLFVEGVQLVGNAVVRKIDIHHVARADERADGDVVGVHTMLIVVAERPAALLRGQIDTEKGSGGCPAKDIRLKAFFYHHVEDTAGVDTPHAASFQYKTGFRFDYLTIYHLTIGRLWFEYCAFALRVLDLPSIFRV